MTPLITIEIQSSGPSYGPPQRRSSVTGTADTTGCKEADSHKRRLPKKSVSFGSKVNVRTTLHIANYREKEIRRCWFSMEECAKIRSQAKKTAQAIENQECPASPIDTRGLESMVRSTREEKINFRNNSIFSVIDEQELQLYEGQNSERLAQVYSCASAPAVEKARARALRDEMESLLL